MLVLAEVRSLWGNTMTNKQLKVLKLFALNHSLKSIAKKLNISVSTVRSKLKILNSLPEFDNACSVRSAYKHIKYNLQNPKNLDGLI